MPPRKFYRKKKFVRKRYARKPNNFQRMLGSTSSTVASMAQLYRTVNHMKNMINCEKKYVDATTSSVVPSSGTYAFFCNGLAEGDDYNARNGRSILMDSLHLRWSAKVNSSATNTLLRIIVVADKKPDVGTPSYTDVMGGASTIAQIDKEAVGDRYVILRNKLLSLNPGANPARTGDIFISLKGIHQKFDNTSSGSTDLESNGIWVFATADEATNTPTLSINSRFSYYDN